MGHRQGKNLSIALSEHAFAGIATLVKVENWKKIDAILSGLYLQTFALHDAATSEYLVEVSSQAGEYFLPGWWLVLQCLPAAVILDVGL